MQENKNNDNKKAIILIGVIIVLIICICFGIYKLFFYKEKEQTHLPVALPNGVNEISNDNEISGVTVVDNTEQPIEEKTIEEIQTEIAKEVEEGVFYDKEWRLNEFPSEYEIILYFYLSRYDLSNGYDEWFSKELVDNREAILGDFVLDDETFYIYESDYSYGIYDIDTNGIRYLITFDVDPEEVVINNIEIINISAIADEEIKAEEVTNPEQVQSEEQPVEEQPTGEINGNEEVEK